MARGISLRRLEPARTFAANRGDVFRIVVYAENAENMPNEIFLFERTLIDPVNETQADHFVTVCSPFDLTLYPANEPAEDQFPNFFRKASIDVMTASTDMAEQVWTAVNAASAELVEAMDRLDRLEEIETVRLGDAISEESL